MFDCAFDDSKNGCRILSEKVCSHKQCSFYKIKRILPCSLCKGAALLYNAGEHGFFVCCVNSDKVSEEYPTEQEAIMAWNDSVTGFKTNKKKQEEN